MAATARELLEQFGLTARRRSAFASLSGGERQRLFLVLALLNRPRLVILDELTQGLDPAARRDVWAAVRQLHADGTTVLLVTHEMDEAEALCDRVVAMRGGPGAGRGGAGGSGEPACARWRRSSSACRIRPRAAGRGPPAGRRAVGRPDRCAGRGARRPADHRATSAPRWCAGSRYRTT